VLTELRPAELALSVDGVADLLVDSTSCASRLCRARAQTSAGWPALVHLMAEALVSGAGLTTEPGSALFGYCRQVLGALPPE
jgi:hypothetical protein